jgi:hypothetical protein
VRDLHGECGENSSPDLVKERAVLREDIRVRLLPALAVLQALHAYPVAGSQVRFAALPLLFVAAICASNGIRALTALPTSAQGRRIAAVASIGATCLAGLAIARLEIRQDGRFAAQAYSGGVSLNLPGSSRVRLPPDEVQLYRNITAVLNKRCDTFLRLPGLNSFYFWTRKDPPTELNATAWMTLFDDETQRQVVAEANTNDRLCVLRNRGIAEGWLQGKPLTNTPLVKFIRRRFLPVYHDSGYAVLVRRPGRRL